MRRTFQDLARAAEIKDIVTRASSGHATETMQHHYSTVAAEEKKQAIAKVIELAGVRKTLRRASPPKWCAWPREQKSRPELIGGGPCFSAYSL
jgi:hypothetical protein